MAMILFLKASPPTQHDTMRGAQKREEMAHSFSLEGVVLVGGAAGNGGGFPSILSVWKMCSVCRQKRAKCTSTASAVPSEGKAATRKDEYATARAAR